MRGLVRYAAGYVLDFFRERVTAEDFRGERIRRVLLTSDLDAAARARVAQMLPSAEMRVIGRSGLPQVRRSRPEVACIGMAGGAGPRERVLALLSGARHTLLIPSPDYVYRFGMRRGWPALLWGVTDRFALSPLALVWLGALGLRYAWGGCARRALAAERAEDASEQASAAR
jgi:hypothetical protein